MKRFTNILKDRKGSSSSSSASLSASNGSPESTASKAVKAFCEANLPSSAGDEVTYLPTIVEAAESSPAAATACAVQLRKFLGVKVSITTPDSYLSPHVQYNAIMLLRILSDNPGPAFTKNLDNKFVDAVKNTLRASRDPSVQQIIRDTLQTFEVEKAPLDNNLLPLVAMWRKEKANPSGRYAYMEHEQNRALQQVGLGGPRQPRPKTLPPPVELAGRVEEARTTAKLLIQLVQSTPASEIPQNDLIKEFADRCQSAQRSMQGYMNATEPHAPDPDTFQTLIETCEQLNVASSKYQRAVLAVRRNGSGTPSNPAMSPATSPPPSIPNLAALPGQKPVDGAGVAKDPFGDEHQIAYELPATDSAQSPPQATQSYGNSSYHSAYSAANSLGATAAQQQAALDAARARKNAQQTSFSPPPGPPPGQSAPANEKDPASSTAREVADEDDDDDDLYGSPSVPARNTTANSQTAGKATVEAPSAGITETAPTLPELRIKDDDPLPDDVSHQFAGMDVGSRRS